MQLCMSLSLLFIVTIHGNVIDPSVHVVSSNTTIYCPTVNIDELKQSNAELKQIIQEMWTTFQEKLTAIETRLGSASNHSIVEVVTNATITPDLPRLANQIYQNLTVGVNWTLVYDQPYKHNTSTMNLRNASMICNTRVVVGARPTGGSLLTVAAIGPKIVLQNQTDTNKPVQYGHVYWYATPNQSFGFSPNSNITQNSADTQDSLAGHRLSWHLDKADGGYRVGSIRELNNSDSWRKVIYCLD
jgi:hypothetical protein